MIHFYSPDILSTPVLPADESMHCVRVLRHKVGDEIAVIDGKGTLCRCIIVDADPRATMLEVVASENIHDSWNVEITLAVAPTKNIDRMEWLTEKAVEIGVNRIIPIICSRSERKTIKTERLRKIAISAMKQSLKASLPEIADATPFSLFLSRLKEHADSSANFPQSMKFMGYCDKEYPLRRLVTEYRPGENVIILIGPEGDFSPEEVTNAVKAGFVPVTFADCRLRTETAAIVGLECIHVMNQINCYSNI